MAIPLDENFNDNTTDQVLSGNTFELDGLRYVLAGDHTYNSKIVLGSPLNIPPTTGNNNELVFDMAANNESQWGLSSVTISAVDGSAFSLAGISFMIYNGAVIGAPGTSSNVTLTNNRGETIGTYSPTGNGFIVQFNGTGNSAAQGITSFTFSGTELVLEIDNLDFEPIPAIAPSLSATAVNPAFTENGSAVDLFNGVTANTNDSGQKFTGVTLTVSNVSNGAAESLTISGTSVGLSNGNAGLLTGGGAYAVAVSGSTATVTVTGLSRDENQMGTLIDGIAYGNTSDHPGSDSRVVTITQVTDDGANNHTTVLNIASTVSVAPVNDAPVATVPLNIAVTEDTASALTGISFVDADAGTSSVTVTLSVGSGSLAATSGGGVTVGGTASALTLTGSVSSINTFIAGSNVTFTTAANAMANVTLTVAVDDGGNIGSGGAQADTETVALVVTAVNDAPTVTAPGSIDFTEDTTGAVTGISFVDLDAGSSSVTVTLSVPGGAMAATSGGDVTVGGTASALTLSGSIANINTFIAGSNVSYTPAANASGNVTLTAVINDGGNTGSGGALIASTTVTLAVAGDNDAPTVANAIANQNATEDSAFNFQFAANTFADVDVGDTLIYSAQLAGGGALPNWLSFNAATRTFSGTPANADVGTVSIDVIANDGNGATVTDTFNIVIANTNDAPTVVNAIPNQNATQDAAFNFQFAANTFADMDAGASLTYSAQLAGGGALPGWLSFNAGTRTFSGNPGNADVGTVSIDVIANDGNGGTVADTFNIVVANINDAPTVANAIADQNATEDSAFNFQFTPNTFADVDGDTLNYTAQLAGGGTLPSWLSFNAFTRTFSGTPANGDVGTISIDVTATDGSSASVTDTFDIVVANTNDAPTVATPLLDRTGTVGSAFNYQFAAGSFADMDVGDTLSYTAQLNGGGSLPAWLSFDGNTRTFSGTPTATGTVTVDLTADDGNGGTVVDSFDIVVSSAPVILPPDPEPPVVTPPIPPGVPDNDGIPSTVEDKTPGIPGPGGNTTPGDGNGDGIKDSEQPSVGSISFLLSPTAQSNPGNAPPTFTTLVASSQNGKVGSANDNARITSLQQLDAPAHIPEGMEMPLGLVAFTVELAQGKTGENFSLYVDPALGVNGYWKQDASGQWVNLASEPYGGKTVMEGGKLRLDFHIEDGGQFDADGKVDGIITDPGAPAHMPLSIMGQAPDMPLGFWF